jgi:hypothetical protein
MHRALVLFSALFGLTAPLAAQDRIEVDVELLLAVDVSRSMTPAELELQRRGYAEALASRQVIGAILDGMVGRIALSYVEWAGDGSQNVVVPWTLLDSAADAQAVARSLTVRDDRDMRRTSISSILRFGANSIETNDFNGTRRVIDVSGDGPNNNGAPVLPARDAVLARGIIINGLPLMARDEMSQRWGIEDLDVYYTNCVIGGPGAFMIPVQDWSQFATSIRRKLVLEIGAAPVVRPRIQRVAAYDCLIGEKIWEGNRYDWP